MENQREGVKGGRGKGEAELIFVELPTFFRGKPGVVPNETPKAKWGVYSGGFIHTIGMGSVLDVVVELLALDGSLGWAHMQEVPLAGRGTGKGKAWFSLNPKAL